MINKSDGMGRKTESHFDWEGRQLWAADQDPGFILSDISRLLRITFDRRVADIGLTRSQWYALVHLLRRDGVTQSELALDLDVEKATVGRTIDKLEEAGFIERRARSGDRRVNQIFLTARAKKLVPKMASEAAQLYKDAFGGLTPDDLSRLLDKLLHVRTNLQKLSKR